MSKRYIDIVFSRSLLGGGHKTEVQLCPTYLITWSLKINFPLPGFNFTLLSLAPERNKIYFGQQHNKYKKD